MKMCGPTQSYFRWGGESEGKGPHPPPPKKGRGGGRGIWGYDRSVNAARNWASSVGSMSETAQNSRPPRFHSIRL